MKLISEVNSFAGPTKSIYSENEEFLHVQILPRPSYDRYFYE